MNCKVTLLSLILFVCIYKVNSACSPCYNGYMDENLKCQCLPGWMGSFCQFCGGRVRVNESSGSIVSQFGARYTDNMRCMWFLETDQPDFDIHVTFELLDTECAWDYLYVFNGDSLHSQKVAAFSGSVLSPDLIEENVTNSSSLLPASECVLPQYENDRSLLLTLQGSALLYFFTDAAADAKGFNLTYWTDCSHNCSGNGVCRNGSQCVCDSGWTGELCEERICPNSCSSNGVCNPATKLCSCEDPYTGPACSIDSKYTHWETLRYSFGMSMFLANSSVSMVGMDVDTDQLQRAGHSAVVQDEVMWVFGGYTFPAGSSEMDYLLWSYHMENKTWNAYYFLDNIEDPGMVSPGMPATTGNTSVGNSSAVSNSSEVTEEPLPTHPSSRYGHSAVVYESVMYVYGGELMDGTISNQLWAFNLTSKSWRLVVGNSSNLPLGVRDHTAHVVNGRMLVFWGYSTGTIPTQLVQQYDFNTGVWSVPSQKGQRVSSSFGHSSVYSEDTGLIYISANSMGNHVMVSYNPATGEWSVLPTTKLSLTYHTATLIGSSIVVYGGRSYGAPTTCFRDDVLVYNIVCKKWYNATALGVSVEGLSETTRHRYSHTAVSRGDSTLLMFGGFNGLLLSDVSELRLANCSAFHSANACHADVLLGLCVWSDVAGECQPSSFSRSPCPSLTDPCTVNKSCESCASEDGCQWTTASTCVSYNATLNGTSTSLSGVRTVDGCKALSDRCSRYTTCGDCEAAGCWYSASSCSSTPRNTTSACSLNNCFSKKTCNSCSNGCLWCPSLKRCTPSIQQSVDVNYPSSYPFGQCLGWAGSCPVDDCSGHMTCADCTADPLCGWCDDERQTGLGVCTQGGFNRPQNSSQCDADLWHFNTCPTCQCNGHSSCANSSSECLNCTNDTTGDNCQYCVEGLYGNPVNNQSVCQDCFCNGFADTCNNRTGDCPCNETGIIGTHCERCDPSYDGTNPLEEYCALPILLRAEGATVAQIRRITHSASYFVIVPLLDLDVTMDVRILNPDVNTSLQYRLLHGSVQGGLLNRSSSPFQVTAEVRGVSNPRINYDITQGEFGNGDTALLFEVLKLGRDFNLSLSFTLKAKDDELLIAFLVFTGTFVICLTVMLAVLGIFWYGFRFYDRQRRIRRHRREMRRRVARPFATVKALVHEKNGLEQQQQVGYIGVEPLEHAKAAVVSVVVQLPCNPETGRPRKDQTGICFGSALVKIKPKQPQSTVPKKKGLFKRKKKITIQQTNRGSTLQRETTTTL